MSKLSIRDLPLNNHRVFLRVDFNVPLDEGGHVTDDTRIRETLPTIEYALHHGARLIVASHLGRPKGKPSPRLSLKNVAERLRILLDERMGRGQNVGFATDCIGVQAEEMAGKLEKGHTLLLENLRFHAEEEANDEKFSRALAKLADYYVNDAFGTAHRAHASTVGITRYVEKSAAGLLMEKELEYLGRALQNPRRPFVAILGGAKVCLKASGREIGKSLLEAERVDLAKQLLAQANEKKIKFLLPVDHMIAGKAEAAAQTRIIDNGQPIPAEQMGLDIGPKSIALFSAEIKNAKTIVWNGPMGVFELEPFSRGTLKIAQAVAANSGAISIVGGGDTVSAIHVASVTVKITHISTGGGASLEFLEGKQLPGVEALTSKP